MRTTVEEGITVVDPDLGEVFELGGLKFTTVAARKLAPGEEPPHYHACGPCVLRHKIQCLEVQCFGQKRSDGIDVHVVHA